MMTSTHIRGAILASCLLLAGCRDNPVTPCDLWTGSAVVSGRVTNSSGAPIAGAAVDIQIAWMGPCDQADNWARRGQVATDANGNYSAEMELGNTNGMRCVSVTELGSGTSVRGAVEFVGGCEGTGPPGQLSLDLVIP